MLSQVYITEGTEKKYLNGPNTINRIDGTYTQALNKISSLIFDIYPDNTCYDLLEEYITKIYADGWGRGRVINIIPTMDLEGGAYKQVICEGELGYLTDTMAIQEQLAAVDTRQNIIDALLTIHNAKSDVQVSIGTIVGYANATGFRNAKNSVLNCLLTDEVRGKNEGLFYDFKYDTSIQKYMLNLISNNEMGTQEIDLGKNLKNITRTPNLADFCTRLYPYGVDEDGNEFPLRSADYFGPAEYVENADLIAKYGIIEKTKTFKECTDSDILRTVSQNYMDNHNFIQDEVVLGAYDLAKLGLNILEFQLSYWYPVKCKLIDYDSVLQLTQITRNINDAYDVQLTFRNNYRQAE